MSLRSVSYIAFSLALCGGFTLPASAQVAREKLSTLVEIAPDKSTLSTMRREVTPLVPAAVGSLSNFTLTLGAHETYEIVEAYTQKADGTRTDIQPSDVITQSGAVGTDVSYVDTKTVRIAFRGVTVGDKLVATIRVKASKQPPLGGVEDRIMVQPSQEDIDFTYTVKAPADLEIGHAYSGMNYLQTTESDGKITRTWSGRFAPRELNETGIADIAFVNPYFEFSTAPSWEEMGKDYWAGASPKAAVTPKVQQLADSITKGVASPRDQARKLHEWVTENMRYVAVYLGNGPWVPNAVDEVIDRRYGDCKDMATLLTALLAAKGIKSEQALVTLTDNYTKLKTPMRAGINHVVVYLPEFGIYADPTNPLTPFGMIEPMLAGKFVIRVGPMGAKIDRVPVDNPGDARAEVETVLTLTPNKEMNVETTTRTTGAFAFFSRSYAQYAERNGVDTFAAQLQALTKTPGKAELSFQSSSSRDEPFVVTGRVDGSTSPEPIEIDAFRVNSGLSLYGLDVANLFGSKPILPRVTPFQCMPGMMTETITIRLPAGVRLEKVPQPSRVDRPFASFRSEWRVTGDAIVVRRELVSKIKTRICPASMAPDVLAFHRIVSADLERKLVFVGWPEPGRTKSSGLVDETPQGGPASSL
jgi:hypothetical protein